MGSEAHRRFARRELRTFQLGEQFKRRAKIVPAVGGGSCNRIVDRKVKGVVVVIGLWCKFGFACGRNVLSVGGSKPQHVEMQMGTQIVTGGLSGAVGMSERRRRGKQQTGQPGERKDSPEHGGYLTVNRAQLSRPC